MTSLKDLKILLLELDMTVTDLAREIGCCRQSISQAFSPKADRDGVRKKIEDFYESHRHVVEAGE